MTKRSHEMALSVLVGAGDNEPALVMALFPNTEYAGVKGHRLTCTDPSLHGLTSSDPEKIKAELCKFIDRACGVKS